MRIRWRGGLQAKIVNAKHRAAAWRSETRGFREAAANEGKAICVGLVGRPGVKCEVLSPVLASSSSAFSECNE